MATIQFAKMHGLGNDFMVIDGVRQSVVLMPEQIQKWSHRHQGVGFDQLLLVLPSQKPDIDFEYRIFNADGSEVAQCGNGARCLARFIYDQGLSHQTHLKVQTLDRVLSLEHHKDGSVTVDMGVPVFEWQAIPMSADTKAITFEGTQHPFDVVNMGNPHAVFWMDAVRNQVIAPLAQVMQASPSFPESVNVGFAEILSRHQVRLRVYERGAGETDACGSGACAAVVCGIKAGQLEDEVEVILHGGRLQVQWSGSSVQMRGPAETVYIGTIAL